ncbi:UNVERIFIED_CONTAM: hypothetical protein Sradi_3984900 [Sesamum radiatum]|uniref:Gag-pol polyprotein n=1 Tax=Sesamum radiatum TaxID=300843 RepID=A0AAW2PGI3_SESRA
MTEGSSVHDHGIKMLSLIEELESLNAGMDNDSYIDVILQSLPPSFGQFVVNYNMNGHEKTVTINKPAPVMLATPSTSSSKTTRVKRWKRNGKGKKSNKKATEMAKGKK